MGFNLIRVKSARIRTPSGEDIYINNFSIRFTLDSPSNASVSFIPQKEDVKLDVGDNINILYGNDAIYSGYISSIDRTLTGINVSLVGFLQVLDWFPIINDNSKDGNIHFQKGTKIKDMLQQLSQAAGWTFNPVKAGFNTEIPSEMVFGNGQSYLEAVKKIADMNGAWLVERRAEQYVWLVLPSSILDLIHEYEAETGAIIMDITRSVSNEYRFAQVLVKDTEGKLKKPVKVYHYTPFPFNKRAIFYTYPGQLTVEQATNIALEIFKRLKIGKEKVTYTLAGYYPVQLLDVFKSYVIVEYEYQYNYGTSPYFKTILQCIKEEEE